MNEYKPRFTDITEWNKKPYSSTGGTRAKNIYVNPIDEREYFFKCSKKLPDGGFRYPSEYWSEIIASKIGQWLGFDVLDYNIGFDYNHEQKIGCLSKSMVVHAENKLSEGIEFLRGYDSNYIPSRDEENYTVDFIRDTLEAFDLLDEIPKMIEMVVFDAIIGNSDRHQENWGFISDYKGTIEKLNNEIENKENGFLLKMGLKLFRYFAKVISKLNEEEGTIHLKSQSRIISTKFSPIYDSGCCLGRELEEERILRMLENDEMLTSYISRGRSEIRLVKGSQKPKHFELITNLKDISDYKNDFKKSIEKVSLTFNEKDLFKLIDTVDENLPENLNQYKLATYRKHLITKLVPLRIKKLQELQ